MNGPRISSIGPYRLESRLGAGGMGEVWLAWDGRLERRVAVKLIRTGAEDDERARERFRREARAAASLSHPSIVQIHDILSSEDGDAIVMELVEGESLASLAADRPLDLPVALRLAIEIADGLAAAHARGIVHRDLKAENVMVTAGGHAKILDFGLAKRVGTEASLTQTNGLVGTCRSMSPEQARGQELDLRSDLFSFGTLLYEVLAACSPFPGGSPLEIMTRICTVRQIPLREVRPEVPDSLSDLVDQLLEKNPSLRPRNATEVMNVLEEISLMVRSSSGSSAGSSALRRPTASDLPTIAEGPGLSGQTLAPFETMVSSMAAPAAPAASMASDAPLGRRLWRRRRLAAILALLLVAAGVPSALLLRRPEPVYIAVPDPEGTVGDATDDASAGLLASALRVSLLQGLLAFEGLAPLAPEQVDPVEGSPGRIARATAASEVLTSRLTCGGAVCQVLLNRVAPDGTLIWTGTFAIPLEQPYLMPEAVLSHLRQGYPDRAMREGDTRLDARPEDYAEYLRLFRSYDLKREEEIPADSLLSRLAAIRATSPRFLETYLFEAYVLQDRFRSRRDPRDLERANELLGTARQLAPADPRPLGSLFEIALVAEQLDKAEEYAGELERLQPGDPLVLTQKARLLERQGRAEDALDLLREAVRRHPSWKHLFRAADMEFRQGRIPEARRHLEELLQRFPESFVGQSLLAQLELLYGSPERSAELYAGLVRRSPGFDEVTNLGLAYFLLGRYARAEEQYRKAVELRPRNAIAVLNLADACLLQGRQAEAAELYETTLRLVEEDPAAAASWQHLSVRAQALAHLGRSREAVAAVQQALRLAPGNAQASYEASLVYTLLGDHASALFSAEGALEQGVDPRWFTFPWFDPLRSAPELQALLKQPSGPR